MMVSGGNEPDARAPVATVALAIDLGHLGRMTLGERTLEREVLTLFVRQGDMLLRRMRQSAPAVIAASAHTLKGSALSVGAWRSLGVQGATFIYLRELEHRRLLVALNMSDEPHALLLQPPLGAGRILVSTQLDRDGEEVGDELDLRADEGVILELSEP